jgi:hypothetical protein
MLTRPPARFSVPIVLVALGAPPGAGFVQRIVDV